MQMVLYEVSTAYQTDVIWLWVGLLFFVRQCVVSSLITIQALAGGSEFLVDCTAGR